MYDFKYFSPSTGGPNLLRRPEPELWPELSGPWLAKYEGFSNEMPPKPPAWADRDPPPPLGPRGVLLAPDIPPFRDILSEIWK